MTARLSSVVAGRPGVLACDAPAARPAPAPEGDVQVTRHFSLTGEIPAPKLALVVTPEPVPVWRVQAITKIQTIGFCDWVSIYQRHFGGGLPVISDGAVMRVDRHGETICVTLGKEKIVGSHETSVFVRCDGETVWFDGNVSKFGRTDNLFGYSFQECLSIINAVLINLQLPPFTEGEKYLSNHKGQPKTVWTGAIVTRIDITENHQTGSAANAYHFMQHLQGQQQSRLKTGTYGDGETVDFGRGSRRLYFKAYLKGPELRRHITKDIKPSGAFNALHGAKDVEKMTGPELRLHFAGMPKNQYVLDVADWCDSMGLVRVEMTFKSTMLHSMGCNYLGALDMKQLEDVFTDRCSIFTRASADVNEITDLPRQVLSTYRMWAAGDDVINKVSRATFYRHRKELIPYGVDIAIKSNVISLKTKTRVIKLGPASMPEWYELPTLKDRYASAC